MYRQDGAPIGETLARGVDDHVLVPLSQGDPDLGVGVSPKQLRHIACIYPGGGESSHDIIQRWLAPFLSPGLFHPRPLHGKSACIGDMLNYGVVPYLVRGLEDRGNQAISDP
jgi:hypothetical protein